MQIGDNTDAYFPPSPQNYMYTLDTLDIVKAENGHVHRECVQPSLVWNMLSKYCSLLAHSVYILQRRTPLQCSLPGSIALRREVQTVHNLHILICQLHLLHCQKVISLQWTFPLWGWLTLLWWSRGWTQHTHNHHLKLLMLLAKSEEGGETRAHGESEQVEEGGEAVRRWTREKGEGRKDEWRNVNKVIREMRRREQAERCYSQDKICRAIITLGSINILGCDFVLEQRGREGNKGNEWRKIKLM